MRALRERGVPPQLPDTAPPASPLSRRPDSRSWCTGRGEGEASAWEGGMEGVKMNRWRENADKRHLERGTAEHQTVIMAKCARVALLLHPSSPSKLHLNASEPTWCYQAPLCGGRSSQLKYMYIK